MEHVSQSLSRLLIIFAATLGLFALSTIISSNKVFAAVDTCTWTGATDGDMDDATNWSGCDNGNLPEAGDSLLFDSSATTFTINSNLAVTFDNILVDDTYTFSAGTLQLDGNLTIFASNVSFNNNVEMVGSVGQKGLSLQAFNTTFANPVDLNITGGGFLTVFTTNSSQDLPSFTGTTTQAIFYGNPTAPLEIFNSNLVDSTFIATAGITLVDVVFVCNTDLCLGDATNQVSVEYGSLGTPTGAVLQFDLTAIIFDYDVEFNDGATFGPAVLRANENVTFNGSITITTDTLFDLPTTTTSLTFNGPVAINADLDVVAVDGPSGISFFGPLSGTGDVSLTNGDIALLNSSPTFDGDFVIHSGGSLAPTVSDSLGSTTGTTTIEAGATLRLSTSGAYTYVETFFIAGNGKSGYDAAIFNTNLGAHEISGTINLTGDAKILNNVGADTAFVLSGVIAGTGNLTIESEILNLPVRFAGALPNTYVGTLTVTGGTLALAKAGGAEAITGNVTVRDNGTGNSGILQIEDDEQIYDTSVVTNTALSTGAAQLRLETGVAETVASVVSALDVDFSIVFDNVGFLAINNTGTAVFGGNIVQVGAGGVLIKIGTGTYVLSGNVSGDLGIDVISGVLSINGSSVSTQPISINGGELQGTGTITDVVGVSGTLAPGNSPGILLVGNLTLVPANTFEVEIDGAAPGTGYDQLISSGTVDLGGSTLTVIPGYTPASGAVFEIILADAPIVGTFAGLAEGSTFVAGGLTFRINYNVAIGPDFGVTLTYIAGTLTPTGISFVVPVLAAVVGISSMTGLVVLNRRRK